MSAQQSPKCMKCKYFYSTFDPQVPRGCKAYNFKSHRFPSQIVKEQSGQECQMYEIREKKSKKVDLNDDSLW